MTNKTPANTTTIKATKRKPGRPPKTTPKADKPDYRTKTAIPDPRNTDPTKPAADPKDELFCGYVCQGITITKSYQLAVNPKSRNISASSRGSEMRNRPDLAARILYLQATTYKTKPGPTPKAPARTPPAAAPAQPPADAPEQPLPNAPLITRQDLERIISAAVRQASTATEKTQAVKLARDMLGLDRPEDAPVDPVALMDYIARTAGRTPQAIAAETGGLRWMLERVAMLSRQPRSHVLRTVRAWTRDMQSTSDPEMLQDIAQDPTQ